MKEVKKCSISGVAFTMDTDAYQELEAYLESLKKTYKETPDGAEIVADIEARIAELILSAQDSTRVVEKPLILNIIRQMVWKQTLDPILATVLNRLIIIPAFESEHCVPPFCFDMTFDIPRA